MSDPVHRTPPPPAQDRWAHVCALFEAALAQPAAQREAFLRATTGADAALLVEVRALLDADALLDTGVGDEAGDGFLDTPVSRIAPVVAEVVAEHEVTAKHGGGGEQGSDATREVVAGHREPSSPPPSAADRPPPDADDVPDDTVLMLAPRPAAPGRRLGPWRLVRELGQGGMGTVWLAERADGAFEQRVAVKRIRASMFSEALRQRFVRERALLARLHHPHIAQLLDGGVTDDGVPYLVMEYVPGPSLLEFCAQRQLDIRARVRLFLDICEAVQYAHRHLVIHRDLKPSNILVAPDGGARGTPLVKLLDFGIGKLQHEDPLTEALTLTGVRPFTPQYAAPEQIRNRAVTTATDVYGLGVLLFEVLTGQRPFTAPTGSVHEIERAVLEDLPPSPSTVLRRFPDRAIGLPDARKAARAVSGDLDAIVQKALAKSPERRYRSAEALARDLKRYLEGKPVQARRGALGYRLSRNLWRHRWSVAAIGTIIALLAAGIIAVATQVHRVSVERDKAVASAQFLSDLFGSEDPDMMASIGADTGDELSARALLERAARRVETELADQPETRAAMQLTLGRVHHSLGLYDAGDALLRSALTTRQRLFGTRHPQVAEVELALGALLSDRSRYAEAERLHRRALAYFETRDGEDSPRTAEALYELGRTLTLRGNFGDAELLLRRALRLQEHDDALSPAVLGHTLAGLAHVLYRQGLLPESEHYYQQALDHYRPTLGPLHVRMATAQNELGVVIKNQGRYADAEPYYRDALDAFGHIYGPAHPRRAYALANLGVLLKDRGLVENDTRHFDAAEPFLEEAHAMYRALYGDSHLRVGHSRAHIGMLALARGRFSEAELHFDASLAYHRAAQVPTAHTARAYPLTGLGEALTALGRPQQALPFLEEALAIRESATGHHWRIAEAQGALGTALLALGRTAEAERYLVASYRRIESGAGETARLRLTVRDRLDDLHTRTGSSEAATILSR
ncbi:MAG: serine/threonine-protein kinase [Bacteroidota bacterium]